MIVSQFTAQILDDNSRYHQYRINPNRVSLGGGVVQGGSGSMAVSHGVKPRSRQRSVTGSNLGTLSLLYWFLIVMRHAVVTMANHHRGTTPIA